MTPVLFSVSYAQIAQPKRRVVVLPELLGGGHGYEARTEGEFDRALSEAWNDRSGMSLLQVHLGRDDASNALRRLADRLSKRI